MDLLTNLFGTDLNSSIFIVLNLIIIEGLLSVDNAAALATMVMRLPEQERDKALKYGIFGAYFFRGLCLIFASLLIKITWLKLLGGLYLIYISFRFFADKLVSNTGSNDETHKIKKSPLDSLIGTFWSTVVLVEVMDLAFSIDNVFAAVAFTNKIGLICLGVFIGILTMRFAAQYFVKLMEKFPFLESSAFIVICILGIKLSLSFISEYTSILNAFQVLHGHKGDIITSVITLLVFIVPILVSKIFTNKKGEKDRRSDQIMINSNHGQQAGGDIYN